MHRLVQQPLLYATLPSRLTWVTQAPHQVASGLQAAACAVARHYSVAQPSRTVEGLLSFSVQQPPSRLTLLFPFSHTDINVITGGYETVQVKVSSDPMEMMQATLRFPAQRVATWQFRSQETAHLLLEALTLNMMAHM